MKILSFFLLLSKLVFAQYDSTMYDLIKTTYERSFDNQIISNYLTSDKDYKIRAAILSIAQSEDTSFVPVLLKLDLKKYGSEVCFALAQIGECNQSIKFLWNYLQSSPPPKHFPKIFFAIGKIGNANDLQRLIEFYNSFDGPIFPLKGISEAILQFQLRGIKNDEAKNILETEITHQLTTTERIEQALFALARYRSNNLSDDQFQSLIFSDFVKDDEVLKQFILMNVNKKIHISQNSFQKLMESKSTLTKIQLVKVLHLLELDTSTTANNIQSYLELLNDENPKVALQTAISIKNIIPFLNDSLKLRLKIEIDKLLFDSTKSLSFKGELFLSRFELFGDYEEHNTLLNKIPISNKHKFTFYSKNPDENLAFNQLNRTYLLTSNLKDRIELLPLILDFQNKASDKSGLGIILCDALTNVDASIISIAADGIDSIFISENSNQLKEIVSDQIDIYKDDPNFLEATMSLVNLAERIDKDFYSQIIEKAKTSKLYSIRKFVSEKTGEKVNGYKELDKFAEIWKNAFKYKQATITTLKGNIVIKFDSEIAPISVANFCTLAKQKFYNGILFHRVVPGFVIQAGDPTATGWGGPGYDIVSEFSDTDFYIGYVGMASAGKNTESSQFFIMQGNYPHLDSKYTLFAKVVEGIDVVYNITEEDKIISIDLK